MPTSQRLPCLCSNVSSPSRHRQKTSAGTDSITLSSSHPRMNTAEAGLVSLLLMSTNAPRLNFENRKSCNVFSSKPFQA